MNSDSFILTPNNASDITEIFAQRVNWWRIHIISSEDAMGTLNIDSSIFAWEFVPINYITENWLIDVSKTKTMDLSVNWLYANMRFTSMLTAWQIKINLLTY